MCAHFLPFSNFKLQNPTQLRSTKSTQRNKAMLRSISSSYFHPISSPSLISFIKFSSLSSLLSPAKKFTLQNPQSKYFFFPNSSSYQLGFKGVAPLSPMLTPHHSCTKCITASYGTESGAESSRFSSGGGREILVQHLLVKEDDHKLLLDLQKRISEGDDLSDLAVEYSICPSKEEGGMLGWVRKGQMVPEFEEAAFTAPFNKVVRCKTKFGWHLLQVLSEREESILEYIQPADLHVKMQDPSFMEEAQLIDVREPEEVAKASLAGFQVLPLRQFGNWGPEIATKFDPKKDTYVLCHHGIRSLQVAKWLQMQGFRRVFNVSGGIHEYAVKVDPSVPTY